MKQVPKKARVVIIGGGVIGCSVAYHLAHLGWNDVVLLERKQLTSGTTWHAAGLIAQLRATANMTKLAKYSQELYGELEKETDIATGFKRVGSITVALTDERKEEIYRQASMARSFGVDVEEISPSEVLARYPHLNIEGVTGGVYLPKDGQADPSNVALSLAKGARLKGVKILEGVAVTGVSKEAGRVSGVDWAQSSTEGDETGHIDADYVVNCGGMWGREIGKMAGVHVPLHACEHFYIVTDNMDGLGQLPVLRVPDEYAYYKEDAGKILLGAFEPNAKPWPREGKIPSDFCFDELPEDFDHFEPVLEKAINRFPALAEAGIRTFFNGPESFTPDDRYMLGEAPELNNFFVAAGFNSIGIQSAGGAGMALAQWIVDGEPPFDLWDVDIRRMQPFQSNKTYLQARVSETLGLLYADHFPYRQPETARNVRRSPLHEHLKARGAVFGEVSGWERANWFANEGQEREYRYSWKRQNWFENAKAEHMAVRESVGMFDMSSFGKIRIQGRDACTFLNNVCGNQMDVAVGRIVYTQMLNSRGGIESDLTVTRLGECDFMAVVPAATVHRDMAWMRRHMGEMNVVITDMTAAESVLCVMGPNSRALLQSISPHDFSHKAHPFGRAFDIEIGMGVARAHRITYVGELGYEIYASADMAAHIFETIEAAGKDHGLKLAGLHTLDSCRIEKGYRHFGHDITDEDHVLEAGLGFAVKTKKPEFIGRDAVLRKQDEGLNTQLVQFQLNDAEPMLYHNEAIVRNGEIVGYLSSGNYGHYLGASIGLGYVPCKGETDEQLLGSDFEIEIAGTRISAKVSLKPLLDPSNERIRM